MSGIERSQLQSEPIPTEGLTHGEDAELVSLLKKWNGGRISTPVFTELARMIPQPIVEVVIFRMNKGVLETLLIPRPADDIVWPGMYHNPGAALRAADFNREDQEPINGAFERVQRGELNNSFAYRPVYAGRLHRSGNRGPEVAEAYFTELPVDSTIGEGHIWYPVDELAQNQRFIQHQLEHVLMAVRVFSRQPGIF